jgi:hypothetical protein
MEMDILSALGIKNETLTRHLTSIDQSTRNPFQYLSHFSLFSHWHPRCSFQRFWNGYLTGTRTLTAYESMLILLLREVR